MRIDNICRNNIEPPLDAASVTAEKHQIENRRIVAVVVLRGRRRPYRSNRGVHYVRALAGRQIATQQELLEIYQSAQALFPDEMSVEDATIDDLDRAKIIRQRPELGSLPEPQLQAALKNMKVMSDARHPTLGGLLSFGRAPQQFRPHAKMTALRISGVSLSENLKDRVEIEGTLDEQIGSAENFVRDHLKQLPEQSPQPLYDPPFQALDEAIVNAVAHRDYLVPSQTRILFFDDRIEIASPGKLLNSVTVEAIRLGYHVVRNPVVFSFLTRWRLATAAGLGVPTMIKETRASQWPEPEFAVVGAEFRVIFRFPPSAR